MERPVKLAVIGAGLIGRRHVELILDEPEAELVAIVDPAPVAGDFAIKTGVTWVLSVQSLIEIGKPDGVIIATPNQSHAANGLECVEAGIAILVEKPIADTVLSGTRLVEAAEAAGVPLLVGHHRRHSAIIREAKAVIDSGSLGTVLAVNAMFWVYKPEEYFAASWRQEEGGGPVLINLVHDIDTLRFLCGEVASVQARESKATRRSEVEDTAAVRRESKFSAQGRALLSDRRHAGILDRAFAGHLEQSCRAELVDITRKEALVLRGGESPRRAAQAFLQGRSRRSAPPRERTGRSCDT